MDMLMSAKIAEARLTDWRKLAQGLHARFLVDDFGAGVRFLAAVGEAGDALGHHPRVSMGAGFVGLELVTDDAVYRDDEDGSELVVEWVTQQDVDLARQITEIAAGQGLTADPASVSEVELGLDAASSATIAPVWAALLTGNPDDQGRGTPNDEIRDSRALLPNLWFSDLEDDAAGQRFHVEVYVAPEVAEQRIAAAVAAGATVVDDSNAPGLIVLADQEGNKGVVCADVSAVATD